MTEYKRLQELLYRLREIMPEIGENPVADEMYNIVFEYAENTDKDVAPVIHARWIDNGRGGYGWAYYCSNCGWIDGYPFEDRHKYCPNCGAKMDESEDKQCRE